MSMAKVFMKRLILVLGGARSGKSRFALELFAEAPEPRFFIATAEALDGEMAARIEHHRAERDGRWRTLEAPLDPASVLPEAGGPVVLDCLSLWLTNLMAAERDHMSETERLLAAIAGHPYPVVLVSNEVGLGLVPETRLGREFRDALGRMNQTVAAHADQVVLMVAGLPLTFKS
jgi:adenosylcobinamide kinase/adenosylcobinamide-phosphate guanylyltransferase